MERSNCKLGFGQSTVYFNMLIICKKSTKVLIQTLAINEKKKQKMPHKNNITHVK